MHNWERALRLELRPKPYKYLDTPLGKDLDKKLLCVFKPAIMIGAGMGTFDVLVNSKPKTYKQILNRHAQFIIPVVGITSTFVLIQNSMVTERGIDDHLNWIVPGATAGALLGGWFKKPGLAFNMALLGGICGFLKKCFLNCNYHIVPVGVPRMHGGLRCGWDWSLLDDPKIATEREAAAKHASSEASICKSED